MNFISLNKQSKTPLYQQLVDSFQKAIESYALLPDQRIPSEEVLCQHFGISRSVVKVAYQKLFESKYIYRNPKGGSYVYPRYRYQAILDNAPFFLEALNQSSFRWSYTVNLDECVDSQRHLKLSYFIESLPVCVSEVWFPMDLEFDPQTNWKPIIDEYSQHSTFKVKVLNKYEALFFNQNESFAVFELKTEFKKDNHVEAKLIQWISPYMGQLHIEV